MEASSVPLLNYGLQQYQWSCPSSDSEFYSVSSPDTVSPVPSMDYSISPTYYQSCGSSSAAQGDRTAYSLSETCKSSSSCFPLSRPGRKIKTRVRSKQRESASEKEKMRMRDLTKALHHLRSYLPPSVVPAGQTLTKIETLRLTIRYISYLSAQLSPSTAELEDGSVCETAPEVLGYLQCSSVTGQWAQGQSQSQHQYPAQCSTQSQPDTLLVQPGCCSSAIDLDQYSGQSSGTLQGDLNSSMDAFLQCPQTTQATSPSNQMYGKHLCSQLVPNEYWG